MPIGSTVVYNAGDLILSTVSSSGNTFQENKIAAATSSIILFNSNGLISSQSLSSTTVGTASVSTTASYLVPTNSYQLSNLTASNIISIGAGSQFHNIYLQKPLVVGSNYHRLHLGTRWYFDTTANVWTSSVQPNVDNPDWTAIDSMATYLSFKVGSVTGSTTSLTTSSYDASERFRITTGGAILSTSGSDTELRIVNNDNANDPKITFYSASTAQWVVGVDDSDNNKFKINQDSLLNASNVITLDTGSNVGIGTTNPLYKLHVVSGPVNFNSGSVLNPITVATNTQISGSGTLLYHPNIIGYNAGGSVSGSPVIHTGISRTANEMFRIDVKGYNYGSSLVTDFTIVGYAYSGSNGNIDNTAGSVIQYSLVDKGNDFLPKWIGVDSNNKIAITFGYTSSIYYFNKFSVDYYSYSPSPTLAGWYIDTTTSSLSSSGWNDVKPLSASFAQVLNSGAVIGRDYTYQYSPPSNGLLVQGNVGIGTPNVTNRLTVSGNISASNLTSSTISAESSIFSVRSTNHPLYLYDNATGIVLARVTNNNPGVGNSTDFILRSGSTDTVRLSTAQSNFFLNNNVGIGLNAPGALLHISTGSTSPSSTHQVEISTAASKRILFFANASNAAYNPIVASGDSGIIFGSSSISAGQCFFIAPWNATAGGLVISGSGQVGIGTSDPKGTLHVVGNITASSINVSGTISSSNLFVGTSLGVGSSVTIGQQLTVGALSTFNGNVSASGTVSASVFSGPHTGSTFGTSSWATSASFISPSGNAFVQGGNSFGATATIGTNDANSLVLETNNTAQLTINSGGKFGIGTGPSAAYKLNIADVHLGSLGSSSLIITTTQAQTSGSATSANDTGIYSVYNVTNFTASTALQNNAMYNALQILGSGSFSGSYRAMRNGILIANTSSLDTNASLVNTYLTNQIATDIPSFSVPNWTAGTYTLVDLITGNSTGSITNLFMHQIGTPFSTFGAGGITVTNAYGVYISRQKQTNVVTNGYGIYQADTADLNIFAGRTRFGSTTAPVNTLDVSGNISASVITASLFSGSVSGSVFGTSSWANNVLTASSLISTNSYTINNLTASNISASGFITASTIRAVGGLVGVTIGGQNAIVATTTIPAGQTSYVWSQPGNLTDQKTWEFISLNSGSTLTLRAINDAYSAATDIFRVNRTTSYFVDGITFPSGNVTASGNIIANGSITAASFTGSFSGSIGNAISSSYALSASFAPTNTNITASWATNSLTASSLIANNNYRVNALTASGPIIYDNAVLLDYSSSNMPTTISIVIQNSTGSYNAAFFDYAIFSSSNSRAGTIVSTWNGGSIVYNETCTTDIGNTSPITMSVGLNAGNVQLVASGSSTNWNIKASARYI